MNRKHDRKRIGFLCLGFFAAGLLLGLSAALLNPRPSGPPAAADTAVYETPPVVLATAGTQTAYVFPSPAPPESAVPAPLSESYPQWDAGTVYVSGDQVLWQEKIYRAKWWTQGETPGAADVWEDTLETPFTAPPVSAPPVESVDPVPKPEGFKVVGYYPSWKPGETEKPRYDVLTHINYAFAIPTAEGGLRPLEHPETTEALLKNAHANGVQVLLAVGGWSYQDTPLEATFNAATATAAKREAFADAIVALCGKYGFDGVDMDWEHPRVDGPSAAQYEAFMLLLAEKLHAQDKLLTAAVLSGATPDGNIYYDAAAHSDQVLAAVDWINVMAYDGGDGERHSSYEFAVACGQYWKDTRGLPADKVVLGLPFYARPSWAAYDDLLAVSAMAESGDHIAYNGTDAWYNGPETVRKKTIYAARELGGVMIWELTQDTADWSDSLLAAIADTVSTYR